MSPRNHPQRSIRLPRANVLDCSGLVVEAPGYTVETESIAGRGATVQEGWRPNVSEEAEVAVALARQFADAVCDDGAHDAKLATA